MRVEHSESYVAMLVDSEKHLIMTRISHTHKIFRGKKKRLVKLLLSPVLFHSNKYMLFNLKTTYAVVREKRA